MKKKNPIEIMSPAGSFEALAAAYQAGAGSVYFGAGKLNMRARSSVNFTLDDLTKIGAWGEEHGVKTYLTVNTIVFDDELKEIRKILAAAKKANITAIIASDLSVIQLCREYGLEIHLSTQCNVTNIEAVKFYSQFADVIVLARELNMRQVAAIAKQIKKEKICGPRGELIRIEMFVHGALCMAVSGKCYISLHNHNSSANRGACLQDCRKKYQVNDSDSGVEMEIDHEYIMSPKDLKTIHFLDKVLNAGVSVLKIEGRGRSPEYVKTVTQCYREAVEAIQKKEYNQEKVDDWNRRLDEVYNRGYWDGYYLGQKLGEWTAGYGSQATKRKLIAGKVTNYFSKLSVAEVKLETRDFNQGDEFLIIGPTTGVVEGTAVELHGNNGPVQKAKKGDICAVPVSSQVRRGDKFYKVVTATPDLFQ